MFSKSVLFLRTLLFYAGYALATVLISLICLLILWVVPVRKRFGVYAFWCRFVLWWLRICCGIHYQVRGLENVPSGPVVVLSNHQSAWETIFLYEKFTPVCPILKKELLNIPFWGWAMRLQKPIAIDRSKPREAGKSLLKQGTARLAEGMSVVVFPEGTRTAIGDIRKFSRGGAQLAVAAQAPVVPVVHNAGKCWPSDTMLKYPGTIKVVIGEVIAVEGRSSLQVTEEFERWVRAHEAEV
jgi:1-acyl-sn-glycerol-3-phosphate acyltransferase